MTWWIWGQPPLTWNALFWLLVLAAGGVWLARILRGSWSKLATGRWVAALLFPIPLLGLIVPSWISAILRANYTLSALSVQDRLMVPFLVLVATLSVLLLWLPLRLLRRRSDLCFLLVAGTLLTILKLGFLMVVQMEPTDDFRVMWRTATQIVNGTYAAPELGLQADEEALQSALLRRSRYERTLPYLVPLQLVFGERLWALRIANLLLGFASSWLAFLLARRWFGATAGRLAFLVSMLAIETWLASGIPTHDIPGAFVTLLGLWVADRLFELLRAGRLRAAAGTAVGLGGVAILIELQRSTGLLVIWCCGLLGLAALVTPLLRQPAGRRLVGPTVAILLLGPAAFHVLKYSLQATDVLRPPGLQQERRFKKIATYTNSWSTGFSDDWKKTWQSRETPAGGWRRFSRRKLLSDLHYNPQFRPGVYARKSARLYNLSWQTYFYFRGAKLPDGSVASAQWEHRLRSGIALFTSVFLAVLALSCWRRWDRSPTFDERLLPMTYLALLALVLILLVETQPRYLYQIWYIGAIYIGSLVGDHAGRREEGRAAA